MIYLQRTISLSPQATLGSWLFTRGLEHMACGTGTAHRVETRPVAANQHETYEESYWSTDWCGQRPALWVTWVGCVCRHASCHSWHPGKLDGRSPLIGFESGTDFETCLRYLIVNQFRLDCRLCLKLRAIDTSTDRRLMRNMESNVTLLSFF